MVPGTQETPMPTDPAKNPAPDVAVGDAPATVKLDGAKVVVNAHYHWKINVGNYESVEAGLSLTVEVAAEKGAADKALAGVRAWLRANARSVMDDAVALHQQQTKR